MSDHTPVSQPDDRQPNLVEEEGVAGFDLGIDVAQPQAPYGSESFDIVHDLGYGTLPDEA